MNMTFPAFTFLGFLNYTGWPRRKGLLNHKKVVSYTIVWMAVTHLVRAGIALGALRPKIAVSLLADLFSKRDWSEQPAIELWSRFDPSEKIANNLDKTPVEVIVEFPTPFYHNLKEGLQDFFEWEFLLTDSFSVHYHCLFAEGLIWGLSHHEEALVRYEEQRQEFLKNLPDMLSYGFDVHSPETLEEYAYAMEESVNVFQDEIRPFAKIPQDLLSLPAIAQRLASLAI
jgi:hypothetical protein